MFEQIIKNHEAISYMKKRRKIHGKLTIRVSFDRSTPTIKLHDGQSSIEISPAEFEALKAYQVKMTDF